MVFSEFIVLIFTAIVLAWLVTMRTGLALSMIKPDHFSPY